MILRYIGDLAQSQIAWFDTVLGVVAVAPWNRSRRRLVSVFHPPGRRLTYAPPRTTPQTGELGSSFQRHMSRREVCHMRHDVGIQRLTCAIVAALALGLGACRVASPPAALTPTPSAVSSGLVVVAVENPQYAPDDTIVATIHNGLATSIFARDGRSDCTVVDLERWVDNSWQIQAPCVNMQPTPHVVQVAPDAVLSQPLASSLSDATGGSWPPGTYRLAFAYVTSVDQPFGQSTVIFSAAFTIA
jgi:hypothetical protein